MRMCGMWRRGRIRWIAGEPGIRAGRPEDKGVGAHVRDVEERTHPVDRRGAGNMRGAPRGQRSRGEREREGNSHLAAREAGVDRLP